MMGVDARRPRRAGRRGTMSNPALTSNTFRSLERTAGTSDVMTLGGTIVKTGILLLIVFAAGTGGYVLTYPTASADSVSALAVGLLVLGLLGGFGLAMVTIFVPRLAPITSPLYAACKGFALG